MRACIPRVRASLDCCLTRHTWLCPPSPFAVVRSRTTGCVLCFCFEWFQCCVRAQFSRLRALLWSSLSISWDGVWSALTTRPKTQAIMLLLLIRITSRPCLQQSMQIVWFSVRLDVFSLFALVWSLYPERNRMTFYSRTDRASRCRLIRVVAWSATFSNRCPISMIDTQLMVFEQPQVRCCRCWVCRSRI